MGSTGTRNVPRGPLSKRHLYNELVITEGLVLVLTQILNSDGLVINRVGLYNYRNGIPVAMNISLHTPMLAPIMWGQAIL